MAQLALLVTGLFATGATLMALSHSRRVGDDARRREDWIKYGVYAVIIVTMLLAGYVSRWLVAAMLLAISVVGSLEFGRALRGKVKHPTLIALTVGVLVTPALGHLLFINNVHWFASFAFVFLLVSISDSFAQLWGRLLGRHKLCPRLSPGKTYEGLIGGMITAMVGAVAMAFLLPGLTQTQAACMGGAIAAAATVGDLLFSFIKRKLGIKDFSGLLPDMEASLTASTV